MRIPCPHCGERGNEEFSYLGDATVSRPAGDVVPSAGSGVAHAWMDYVYLRQNPPGAHRELWQHVHGCRLWLVVTRNVSTHEILGAEIARDVALARGPA